jgi:excisionase family DNA binding protein
MVAGSSDNELVSVREAAKECGKNAETVRRWIWSGKLPAQKLGNQLFIKKRELIGFCREIATQRYKAGPKPDFLERAIALQNRIKKRGAEPTNAAELIRKVRQERMNELKQSLH